MQFTLKCISLKSGNAKLQAPGRNPPRPPCAHTLPKNRLVAVSVPVQLEMECKGQNLAHHVDSSMSSGCQKELNDQRGCHGEHDDTDDHSAWLVETC